MSEHKCKACLIYCIDFRLHENLNKFVVEQSLDKDGTDIVRVAGVARNLTRPKEESHRDFVIWQLEASHRLHGVTDFYLVNHEDCGAYGLENVSDSREELETHVADLQQARAFLEERFPEIKVLTFFQRLDGEVEQID
jgi:hypothetical protein